MANIGILLACWYHICSLLSFFIFYRKYNDVPNWKYTSLLETLNDSEKFETASYTVNDKTELSNLLDDATFAQANKIQVVEVIMEALDAPLSMKLQGEQTSEGNTYGDK